MTTKNVHIGSGDQMCKSKVTFELVCFHSTGMKAFLRISVMNGRISKISCMLTMKGVFSR
jgi:hypothetical protein